MLGGYMAEILIGYMQDKIFACSDISPISLFRTFFPYNLVLELSQ